MEFLTNTSQYKQSMGQIHIRTNCQNCPIAFHVHKWSSMWDMKSEETGQSVQIVLCAQNRRLSGAHSWTRQSWRSSAHPEACFSFTKEKLELAASVEQEKQRGDPQNKWFWQLLGCSPKFPSEASEPLQLAHHNHQLHNRHGLLPILGKTSQKTRCVLRAPQLHIGR